MPHAVLDEDLSECYTRIMPITWPLLVPHYRMCTSQAGSVEIKWSCLCQIIFMQIRRITSSNGLASSLGNPLNQMLFACLQKVQKPSKLHLLNSQCMLMQSALSVLFKHFSFNQCVFKQKWQTNGWDLFSQACPRATIVRFLLKHFLFSVVWVLNGLSRCSVNLKPAF